MPFRLAVLALAVLAALTVCRAEAQSAAPGSRAEDEASRPLRRIIEASKIKPKPKAADAAPRPAATPASAAATLPARSASPAAEAAAPQPAAPLVVPADPGGPPQSTVATVEVEASPRAPQPEPQPERQPEQLAVVPPAPEATVALPPPKRLSLVEPVTPRNLVGRLQGEIRVEVALRVAADGSVSEAAVTASSHPQMNAAVLDAVRQWRYEPTGQAREHAVQVVLRPDS